MACLITALATGGPGHPAPSLFGDTSAQAAARDSVKDGTINPGGSMLSPQMQSMLLEQHDEEMDHDFQEQQPAPPMHAPDNTTPAGTPTPGATGHGDPPPLQQTTAEVAGPASRSVPVLTSDEISNILGFELEHVDGLPLGDEDAHSSEDEQIDEQMIDEHDPSHVSQWATPWVQGMPTDSCTDPTGIRIARGFIWFHPTDAINLPQGVSHSLYTDGLYPGTPAAVGFCAGSLFLNTILLYGMDVAGLVLQQASNVTSQMLYAAGANISCVVITPIKHPQQPTLSTSTVMVRFGDSKIPLRILRQELVLRGPIQLNTPPDFAPRSLIGVTDLIIGSPWAIKAPGFFQRVHPLALGHRQARIYCDGFKGKNATDCLYQFHKAGQAVARLARRNVEFVAAIDGHMAGETPALDKLKNAKAEKPPAGLTPAEQLSWRQAATSAYNAAKTKLGKHEALHKIISKNLESQSDYLANMTFDVLSIMKTNRQVSRAVALDLGEATVTLPNASDLARACAGSLSCPKLPPLNAGEYQLPANMLNQGFAGGIMFEGMSFLVRRVTDRASDPMAHAIVIHIGPFRAWLAAGDEVSRASDPNVASTSSGGDPLWYMPGTRLPDNGSRMLQTYLEGLWGGPLAGTTSSQQMIQPCKNGIWSNSVIVNVRDAKLKHKILTAYKATRGSQGPHIEFSEGPGRGGSITLNIEDGYTAPPSPPAQPRRGGVPPRSNRGQYKGKGRYVRN